LRVNETTPEHEPAPVDELSYEEAIAELEVITDRIEGGEIGLQRSVTEYERGVALIKRCRELLGEAEQRIEEIGGDELLERAVDDDDDEG